MEINKRPAGYSMYVRQSVRSEVVGKVSVRKLVRRSSSKLTSHKQKITAVKTKNPVEDL